MSEFLTSFACTSARVLLFPNGRQEKITLSPIDEDINLQFDVSTDSKLNGYLRQMITGNVFDHYTVHYIILPFLSEVVRVISLFCSEDPSGPTTGSSFYIPGKINGSPIPSVLQNNDQDFMIDNGTMFLEEKGLALCHTDGSLFKKHYRPRIINPTSALLVSLPNGIFSIHPMPFIPVRQQVLAMRSFMNKINGNIMADRSLQHFSKLKTITEAGNKQEDDTVPDPTQMSAIIAALLLEIGLRPADFISCHGHREVNLESSIFVTGGLGWEGDRGARRRLVL